MAYEILDNRNNTDMEKGLFASLSAIQGYQFGREIYSSVIKFKDLADFLEIFPSVQRDIIPRKVASIRKYILTATDENLRFFSSITVSCKGYAFYDSTNKRLAIDVANTKLSINDGQHRFEAIKTTLEYLENEFRKSKNKERTKEIREKIDRLEEMVVPIVIFNGLCENQEKQLFHDLNNLAQRPSRSANIKLNQTDYIARISREVANINSYLIKYGVEKEKASIHKNNPNTILLTTIYNSLKLLFKLREKEINEDNLQQFIDVANKMFEVIFEVLPDDINTKGKYVLEKSYGMNALFRFVATMLVEGESMDNIVSVIKNTDFSIYNTEWKKYTGKFNEYGNLEFSGGSGGGNRSIYNMLHDKLKNL